MWSAEIAVGPDAAMLNVDGVLRPVRRARQWVQTQLREWGMVPELIEDVELVISELVTNAVLHAPPPRSIHLWRSEHELVVAVVDSTQDKPTLREHNSGSEVGRGLQLIGHFALRWGTIVFPADSSSNSVNKVVWCVFSLS